MSVPESIQRPFRRPYLLWLMYVLVPLAVIGLLVWSTLGELARNPARDATADLGPYGLVTIRFNTSPYPPLSTGTVTLSFMPMDSRRRMIQVDEVTYEYGRAGSDQPAGSGEAQVMSDGSGMLRELRSHGQRAVRQRRELVGARERPQRPGAGPGGLHCVRRTGSIVFFLDRAFAGGSNR